MDNINRTTSYFENVSDKKPEECKQYGIRTRNVRSVRRQSASFMLGAREEEAQYSTI